MNLQEVDRNVLKAVIKEILIEDFSLFKDAIKEILAENQIITSSDQANRTAKIEKMIENDFQEYDEVFTALA